MPSLKLYVLTFFCCYIQIQALCPRLCECKWKSGKESVICLNANLSVVPLYLESGTQVLDLTGNNLNTIKYEEFSKAGLVNLQKVYMSKCRLKTLERYSFKHLINLVELDLSYNSLSNVPSHTFDSITELRELKINGNPITKIFNDAFFHLTQLIRLEMSDCRITLIEPRAFVGLERSLEWLKLDKNRLDGADAASFTNLQGLHGLDLATNPWNCSCSLRPLRIWMVRQNVPFGIPPVCQSPKRLYMKPWDKLDLDEYACLPEIVADEKTVQGLEGNNVTLKCRTAGAPEPIVRWLFKNKVIANLSTSYSGSNKLYIVRISNNSSDLSIYNVDILDAGSYVCSAENKAGRAEASLTLTISKKPPESGFSNKMLLASVLTGTALVIVVCLIALCLCSVKKKQVVKWRNRDCGRDDNYEKIEMNHKTVKVNGGVGTNPDKNGEYRVVPGGEVDQSVEDEEESNVDASSSKNWNSTKSLEKVSPQHIDDLEDLHIPRRTLQVLRDNITKTPTSTCGTYRQYSPTTSTNTTLTLPPNQPASSFRRYIPQTPNFETHPCSKELSEKYLPSSVSNFAAVPKELSRVSEDAERNYPDLIERSSVKRYDDGFCSGKIFQGFSGGKVYGNNSRAASESGSVQDINEIFCTLPRKRDLARSSRYNSSDSQSPLLPGSSYVHECKEKWKNIRNGFVRSLKPKASGSATNNKKKYYLHDEMQFVLPYVKPVIHTEERGNLPSPQEPTQNHEPASPEEYADVDSNRNTAEETGSEHVSQVERPPFKKPKTKIKPVNNEADKAFVDWLRQRKSNEDDPRKMFLLSLLPDVQSLTDEQMSAFRIKVLMLLEEIKKPTCSPTQIRSDQYTDYSDSPISSVYSYSSQAQASTPSSLNYSAPNSSMSQYSNQYRADSPLSSIYSQAQATISDPINYSVTNLSTTTNIEFSQNINDFGDFTTQ